MRHSIKKDLFLGLVLLLLCMLCACGSMDYEDLFSQNALHEVEIVISQEEWDGLIQDMKDYAENDPMGLGRTGKYRKATFVYCGPAGVHIIEEVGFRTKGNVSRTIPQEIDDETGERGAFHRAHFKVKFNETFDLMEGTDEYEERDDRRFCKLRKLDFRMNAFIPPWWDKSQIRENYSYDLLNRAGCCAPRASSAKLYITIEGVRHYFGIYTMLEPVDKSFLTKRFGKDANDGNLYKCLLGDSGPATLEPVEDIPHLLFPEERVMGSKDWETNYRPTYDLKTNEDQADHRVLVDFIDNLNMLNGSDLKTYLDKHFEVDRFLKTQAINVLLGKWDDYWPMGNNYYLYFNNNGKIEFIPVDYDMVLGQAIPLIDTDTVGIYEWRNIVNEFLCIQTGIPLDVLDSIHTWESPLVKKILEIPEYCEVYEQYIIDLINPANGLFVYSAYEEIYDEMAALYEGHLDNDIDEGENMKKERRVRDYFYTRTKAVVDELGLNEAAYETMATSLDPPFDVAASDNISSHNITVRWDPETYGDFFNVFRSDSEEGTYDPVGEHIMEYFFDDDAVEPTTTYYYKVKAYTDEGVESDFSTPVTGSTSDASVPVPSNVTASDGVFNNAVMMLWEASVKADYYRVYRSETVFGPYDQVSGDLYGTVFYDLLVDADIFYYYKVKAYSETGDESDFSIETAGRASTGGADGPEIIQGDPVVSGTYSSAQETSGTYIFNQDGSCTRVIPATEDPFADYYHLEGTWKYEGPRMVLDTFVEQPVLTLRIFEAWQNVFTTDNGEKLYLVGARQTKPDAGEFMKFVGSGLVWVTLGGGFIEDEIINLIHLTIIINEDGSGNLTLISGEGDPVVESWSADETPYENGFQLIEFRGAYFLPGEDDSLFIQQ